MESFFTLVNFDEDAIQQLISSQAEESLYLDFKAAGSIDKSEKRKAEIGKDIAAFANADGGIIVYGLSEINHVADSLSFIDGQVYTKEWLSQVIQTSVSPKIIGLEIFPIRFGQQMIQSIYVVRVPASNLAPHMAADKRYYRRYNFQSVPMEDYEVRNLFQRTQKVELEIMDLIIESSGGATQASSLSSVGFKIAFQLKNISNSIEHHYKMELHLPSGILSVIKTTGPMTLIRKENGYNIYSFFNDSPLFQNEQTTLKTIFIDLNQHNFRSAKIPLIVKLYYTNGVKERTFVLHPLLYFQNKHLSDWGWQ